MEKKLVEDYLQSKGYTRQELDALPEDVAKQLMREACTYASLKLAELQAKSQFREEIHIPLIAGRNPAGGAGSRSWGKFALVPSGDMLAVFYRLEYQV